MQVQRPSSNGAAGSLDNFSETIRRFVNFSAFTWSPMALRMVESRCTSEQELIDELMILEHNREIAGYKELGFTHHPKTGEPL